MSVVGPTRLVLLRAGKYDYGEVELVRPLHLIGPNNVGKTSLIATLQFLYIDDQRQMHFARDMAETRRYYFPDGHSYVLFECLTPTGFQVFGVRGLGPLKQYEIERFTYQGRFDAADFLDEERRVREPEEVKARLASRDYTLLEARHLRAALTGIGDSRGVHLGLVPLRHRDHYARFRTLFRNLLRLAHLRQEELKEFLVEIHAGEFQQPVIDLEKDYAGPHERVRRGALELRDLRAIEPEARRMLDLARRRAELRAELPALWEHVVGLYTTADADDAAEIVRRTANLEELRREEARMGETRRRTRDEQHTVIEERGGLRQRLADVAERESGFQDYLLAVEQERGRRLEAEIEELGVRLRGGSAEPAARLETRIARGELQLARLQALAKRVDDSAAALLTPLLSDDQLGELFRFLNPALLGLPAGEDGLAVDDPQQLGPHLERAAALVAGGAYRDRVVRVDLAAVPSPDLGQYRDPARIAAQIQEEVEALGRDREALAAAVNADALRRRLEQLRAERDRCVRSLAEYRELQQLRARAEEWQRRFTDLGEQEVRLAGRLAELDQRRDELAEALRTNQSTLETLEAARRSRRESMQRLVPPDPEWQASPTAALPESLEESLSRYVDDRHEEQRADRALREGLEQVLARTYGRFDRGGEAESLDALAQELDAIEEKSRALQDLWKGLAAGLRSAFKALNKDLETLRSRVDQLNRSLANVSVSNLARLRLLVREHPEWVRRIRTVAVDEEMPLFSDRGAVETALEQLGDLLSHYPKVRLLDLFHLHFEVSTPDGASRVYPHLDSIESNGTTITIKVLVNLMLLRGLLGNREISLPFYLDEVASLDPENLAGIVAKSLELGFVPVLASPEAMDAAENLYFLTETKGRVLLEPHSSLVRLHRGGSTRDPAEDATGAP